VRLPCVADKSAATVAAALFQDWFSVYGIPRTIMSDQGKEFCNQLQTGIWKQLAINHQTTTPYHPQTNSQAEVFNKTMAHYLRTAIFQDAGHADGQPRPDWQLLLAPLTFSHNTAVHKATRDTPFHTMFGYDPRAPLWLNGNVLDESYYPKEAANERAEARRAAFANNQHARDDYYDQAFRAQGQTPPHDYKIGDHVWMQCRPATGANPKLAPKFEEAVITALPTPATVVVRRFRGRRRQCTLNRSRIKPRAAQSRDEEGDDAESTLGADDDAPPPVRRPGDPLAPRPARRRGHRHH
jgi:hypothetical protein